jgi:hypothetical protein
MNCKTKMVTIEAKKCIVHPYAQRGIHPSRVAAIKKSMDLDAIGVMHGVDCVIDSRPGIYIVDGQHRLTALLELDLGDWPVSVMVHEGVHSVSEASALFLRLNDRASIPAYDKYLNELRAGVPAVVEMTRIVEASGMKMARTCLVGTINSPHSIRRAYDLDGGKSLTLALNVISRAWGFKDSANEGLFIEGMTRFFRAYSGYSLDIPGFVQRLSKLKAAFYLVNARTSGKINRISATSALVDEFLRVYNSRRTTHSLPAEKGKQAVA